MGRRKRSTVPLRRAVGLPLLVFYGLGNILGAGIYVLIGEIAGLAGRYAPLSFLLACLIVLLTALSYAELSARFPKSAGEALYLYKGFGSQSLSTVVGLMIALSGLLSSATIVRGFYGYLETFVTLPYPVAVLLLLSALTAVAVWGITQSMWLTALFTFLESLGLLLIVFLGLPSLHPDPAEIVHYLITLDTSALHGIVLGAFLAFYAFLGFEDMVNVAEEVRDPSRTMPLAILFTLLLATILYALVSIVAVSVLTPSRLAASDAPLSAVFHHLTGSDPLPLSLIAIFAVVNGALIQIIMASRIFYGMSREGWLPEFLGKVHPRTHTPIAATLAASAIVALLSLWFPLVTLAKMTSFLIFIVFTLVNLSLVRIKKRSPHPPGIRTYPLMVPLSAVVLNLFMLVYQLYAA